jgi:hypothetical protein
MSLRFTLIISTLLALSGCSTTEVLKQPCSDPAIHSYVEDDCGPLLPVNESFDEILVTS